MARAAEATHASIRRHLLAAGALSALLLGGVGVWAGSAEFSGAVIAPGFVVVDSASKKVQHAVGGIVGELRVRDGDRVRSGDILLRLDATQTAVNLAIVAKSLDELMVRRARLEAERDGLPHVDMPDDLGARAGEDAELARLITGERRLFELRGLSRAGQQAQLRERVQQLREQIAGVDEQIGAKREELDFIAKELRGVRELYEKNLIPLQRVTALERDAARLRGENGALIATLAQTRARITETELQILQIDQDLRTEVGRDLGDVRAKIAEFSERKVAAEDQLRRTDIRAPADGVVHQLAVHTVGGVIAVGEALMLIVPEGEGLSVEARIAPERIDQITVGQETVLRFSAFDQRTTPEVGGAVARVSADLTVDQRTGAAYYVARVTVPEAEQARLPQRLIPGMPAEVFIQTGQRTVITYLTKPLVDQMRRSFRER